MVDDGPPIHWRTLDGFSGFVSWMLSDACYNWVYVERGLEVVRSQDRTADIPTITAVTIDAYRALAAAGTDFGWFTMEDPDTFHPYEGPPGDLSPVLIGRLRELEEIPSPSTLGFLHNSRPDSDELVQEALDGFRRLRSD